MKDERPKTNELGYSRQERERTNDEQALPLNLTLDVNAAKQRLPRAGLGIASHGQPTSQRARERLRALHLDHLRADFILAENEYENQLRRTKEEAEALGVLLHITLLLSEGAGNGD